MCDEPITRPYLSSPDSSYEVHTVSGPHNVDTTIFLSI